MHPRSYQSAVLPPRRLRASTAPCNIAIDPPIAIIGGGLAGVACSISLTRHGIAHKIYEAAGCFGEVGVGIAMGPNILQVLLGCDGIRSVTRRAVLLSDPASIRPAFAGEYCYRNLVPLHEAQRALGDYMATNGNIFCRYDGCVTTYPVANRGEECVNIAAMQRESKSAWPDTEVWQKPCTRESMVQDFEGWGVPILQLLDTFKEPRKWPPFDPRAAKTHTRGRLCLPGDAVHASTPHHGAGVAMAFEDAWSMTYLFSEASGSQDVTKAFRAFDEFRRPRTQRLVSTSRVAGQVFEFTHKRITDNIDSIRENLRLRHWIWDFNILYELKRVDRQWKAISAARQPLPSLWEEQSVDVTVQEVPSEGDDFDSETCSDDEYTDEEFELLSECGF